MFIIRSLVFGAWLIIGSINDADKERYCKTLREAIAQVLCKQER